MICFALPSEAKEEGLEGKVVLGEAGLVQGQRQVGGRVHGRPEPVEPGLVVI